MLVNTKKNIYVNGFTLSSLAVKQRRGANLKLSISCLPNFLQVSQELQVLLRPSQPPLSPLYTLQQISEFCWNFPIFFQFAVFTKITNLVELFLSPFTAFSLMQWIFDFFVIFATACKPGHISFVIIVFHYSLARQCLWSLLGEVLFKSLPQNVRPVSPTGPFLFKRWIHNHYSLD